MTSTHEVTRFLDSIRQGHSECLEWPFGRDGDGYGFCRRFGYLRATHVVLHMFGQPRPGRAEVLHSCDNPPCVNPDHLKWGTPKTNAEDRAAKGRNGDNRGSRHGMARLTEKKVLEMRAQYTAGGTSYSNLAKQFGVTTMTAYRAVKGTGWRHA